MPAARVIRPSIRPISIAVDGASFERIWSLRFQNFSSETQCPKTTLKFRSLPQRTLPTRRQRAPPRSVAKNPKLANVRETNRCLSWTGRAAIHCFGLTAMSRFGCRQDCEEAGGKCWQGAGGQESSCKGKLQCLD